MGKREILRLGNPELYTESTPVQQSELTELEPIIQDLHDTLFAYREEHGKARAIAAPQIGVFKRLIYMHIDRPKVIVNPVIYRKSDDMIVLWDDCMSFPDLLVKVKRHRSCMISYRDDNWEKHRERLEGELSELLQHECDHLYGILATYRAADERSFACKSEKDRLSGRFANDL